MAQYTRAVNTIDAGLWVGGVGRWKGEERDIDRLQFELVLLAFHFNTKRKFVLPLAEDEGEEAAIGGMLPLLRSCCCCCCALRKEIYVHYRLFLSDDVNFVAFLAFAACGMRQKKRDRERQREREQGTSFCCAMFPLWLCAARCTLHIGYRCIERKLKIFSWRCLSCLINVVLDCCCCCCCSCWCIAWQHLICCAHALATLLPVLMPVFVPQSIANVANTQRNSRLNWECIYKATERYISQFKGII